jgi:hypothetical protein
MSTAVIEKVRCRPVAEADLPAVAALLTEGFPDRTRAYWDGALDTLRRRKAPEGYPRFGYLLESQEKIVGALLLIFSEIGGKVRSNCSSWYVDPAYRAHAAPLVSQGLKFKDATYLNVSPAENTWPIIEAQGYRRYSDGQFACLPAFSLKGLGAKVRAYDPARDAACFPDEAALLDDHRAAGCVVLTVERAGGIEPFVFLPRKVKGLGRALQLAYCRDTAAFTANAGPIGRYVLLRRGVGVVLCDGEGPIAGLIGRFFKDRAPKYFKGADRPRLNDLAYTEAVLFGA